MSGLQSAFFRTLVLLGVLTSWSVWGWSAGGIFNARLDELDEHAAIELKNIRTPADLARVVREYPELAKMIEAYISDPYKDYFSGQLTKQASTDGWESVVDSGMGDELLALYKELGLCGGDVSEPKGKHLMSAYISNTQGQWISVFKQYGTWNFRLGHFEQPAVDKSHKAADAAEPWRNSPCVPLKIQFFEKALEHMDDSPKEELDNIYAYRLPDGTLFLVPDLAAKKAGKDMKEMQARMASKLAKKIAKMAHDAGYGENIVMKIKGYRTNDRDYPLFSHTFTLKGAADAMCQAGGCGKYLKAGQDMVKALRRFWSGDHSYELNQRKVWSYVLFLWTKQAEEYRENPWHIPTAEWEESTADLFSENRYGHLKDLNAAKHKETWFFHIDKWSKIRALNCLLSE